MDEGVGVGVASCARRGTATTQSVRMKSTVFLIIEKNTTLPGAALRPLKIARRLTRRGGKAKGATVFGPSRLSILWLLSSPQQPPGIRIHLMPCCGAYYPLPRRSATGQAKFFFNLHKFFFGPYKFFFRRVAARVSAPSGRDAEGGAKLRESCRAAAAVRRAKRETFGA